MASSFDTFEAFPNLPRELQEAIWEESCPTGQIVEVKSVNEDGVLVGAIESNRQELGLLGACRASRMVYHRRWFPIGKFTKPAHQVDGIATAYPVLVYLNPSIDILYLGPTTLGQLDENASVLKSTVELIPKVKELKTLAIENSVWESSRLLNMDGDYEWKAEFASLFPLLQTINVIRGDCILSRIESKGLPFCAIGLLKGRGFVVQSPTSARPIHNQISNYHLSRRCGRIRNVHWVTQTPAAIRRITRDLPWTLPNTQRPLVRYLYTTRGRYYD